MTRLTSALVLAAALSAAACRATRPDPAPEVQPQAQVDAKALEARMIEMAARMDTLRAKLEDLQVQNDSLRRATSRMESEVRDREEQIKAIRLELQRLKEIDLKPKRPPG
jgi:septal ring factor EnvC (AmiA/AmiB activator)